MNPQEFCYWLQGALSLSDEILPKQRDLIEDKLKEVLAAFLEKSISEYADSMWDVPITVGPPQSCVTRSIQYLRQGKNRSIT